VSAERYDVVVVGGGNAAFCAAHAAREQGARVLMLEKADRDWAGGNSYFSAGAFRTAFSGLEELRPLLEDLSDEQAAITDVPPYTADDFHADMLRVTAGRCDPMLPDIMVRNSTATVRWLKNKGIRWRLMYDRQSFFVNGNYRFWGGLVLGTIDGGVGLIDQHAAAAQASGVELRYGSSVVDLVTTPDGVVNGVVYDGPLGHRQVSAGSVVLACGGFEADPQLRAQYLGPNWDLAKVRGVPHNTGDGLWSAAAIANSTAP
jgi:tricarballylate dehydrogenase